LLSFTVMFIDLPREVTLEPPGAATTLAHSLVVARMLRWGVVKDLEDRILEIDRRYKAHELTEDQLQKEMAAEIHRFLGRRLTVLVEARNRGYQRPEMQKHFEGAQRVELDSIIADWDKWFASAKEMTNQFDKGLGKIEELQKLVDECL